MTSGHERDNHVTLNSFSSSNDQIAVTVFAHPDDAEISCFGLLAKLRKQGWRVVVVVVTKGENGTADNAIDRCEEARAAARQIGAEIVFGDFQDGNVSRSAELVDWVEKLLDQYRPKLIVTHFNGHAYTNHQDHVAVEAAVQVAARRAFWRPTLLLAEGIDNNLSFQPNWFVDISEEYQDKIDAIAQHRSQSEKYYMQQNHVEIRARKWALNFKPSPGHNGNSYWEAFFLAQHAI